MTTTRSIRVTWTPSQIEIETLLDMIVNDCDGVLTTDHAASSRGLPVLVRDDGVALGPTEVGELTVCTYVETDDEAGRDVHRELTADERGIVEAARVAGYQIRSTVTDICNTQPWQAFVRCRCCSRPLVWSIDQLYTHADRIRAGQHAAPACDDDCASAIPTWSPAALARLIERIEARLLSA